MSFQQVRGAIAKLTSDALAAGGVPFADQHWDNVTETPNKDAAGTYAVINISFPQVVTETIGCEGSETIMGSCNVLLYVPRRKGMKPAEDVLAGVLREWVRVNRALVNEGGVHLKTKNINGPNALGGGTIEETRRPHSVVNLSCAFTARVP